MDKIIALAQDQVNDALIIALDDGVAFSWRPDFGYNAITVSSYWEF